MAENVPPGAPIAKGATSSESTARGLPYYEKLRRDLRDMIQKKRLLDKNLTSLEETIYRHESAYLEETSAAGNIIKGFDNYIKSSAGPTSSTSASVNGTISGSAAGGGPGAGRRKLAVNHVDRVFSRSSVGFMTELDSPNSANTTPSHAATPTGSFAPARSGNDSSATASVKGGGDKKKKKMAAAATEESETDERATKRCKITYARKGEE